MQLAFRELAHGRLFRHPIHVMLVHFPSALFPVSLVLDIAGVIYQKEGFAMAGFFAIGSGVVTGFAAAFFGALDYFNVPSDHPAWKKASLHAILNFVWLIAFALLFVLRMNQYPDIAVAKIWQIVVSAAAVIGLLFSNYLGGDLVLRHGIGTIESRDKLVK